MVRAGAAILSNLFYAQPMAMGVAAKPAGAAVAAGAMVFDAPESSQFGAVTLAPDPSFRARETEWAEALLPYHHSWGDEMDYLLLPRLPETRGARKIARSLATHNLLRCKTPSANWRDVDRTPFAMDVRDQLGDRCEQLVYEVYTVRADYAQTLRLALIEGDREGGPVPQHASVAI
ncbi:hypothetical protein KAK07_11915 [Ideonella sp. 4Y16]|uniref:hypothetical protein n=1 Tax=Ideonella alba TaxID=2824118 RepID=UPI001B37FFE8|nr:hypothetical protein [Ideonella alba]MBQ0944041.1 hypothetical protein [Ideonella alba]